MCRIKDGYAAELRQYQGAVERLLLFKSQGLSTMPLFRSKRGQKRKKSAVPITFTHVSKKGCFAPHSPQSVESIVVMKVAV